MLPIMESYGWIVKGCDDLLMASLRVVLNVLNSSYNVEKKREIANFRLYFNETSSGNGRDSRKRDGD